MSSRAIRRLRNFTDWAVIVIFVAAIFAPPVQMFFSPIDTWSDGENRALAVMPPWPKNGQNLTGLTIKIDRFLDDHFGFRQDYIARYQRQMLRWFDILPASMPVLRGLDGWYFFTMFQLLDDFYGRIPLTAAQIQTWIKTQTEKQRWLYEQGIRYLLVIPPNKQSVYPQMLDENALAAQKKSRRDQVVAALGDKTFAFMPDLQEKFRNYSGGKPLYYRGDSHWNDLGASLAFQEMINTLSRWFPGTNFHTDYAITKKINGRGGNSGMGGDLVRIVGIPNHRENYPCFARRPRGIKRLPLPYHFSDLPPQPDRPSYLTRAPRAKNQLKALVFRDSFFVPLAPLIAENFGEVIFLWKSYDKKNVEEAIAHFKPDVVIEEIVERHMFDFMLKKEKP
ncbi:MAG: hypothetical protein LBU39_02765 [Desulfobulbaceae bacterium]|jgi:hypothetical protein|nr:hypothetical protein [Desulfobulbaceae bacterium]